MEKVEKVEKVEKGEKVEKVEKKETTTRKIVNPLSKAQEEAQMIRAIVEKHTIKDKEGRNMFVDEDAIYREMCLPQEEAEAFLGANPEDYFTEGLVHRSWIKTLGNRLDEDDVEVQTLREIAPTAPDIIVFKNKLQNLYTFVIPKRLSPIPKDIYGDYAERDIKVDTIVVNFDGRVSTKEFGSFPSSFEPTFFKRYFDRSLKYLGLKK